MAAIGADEIGQWGGNGAQGSFSNLPSVNFIDDSQSFYEENMARILRQADEYQSGSGSSSSYLGSSGSSFRNFGGGSGGGGASFTAPDIVIRNSGSIAEITARQGRASIYNDETGTMGWAVAMPSAVEMRPLLDTTPVPVYQGALGWLSNARASDQAQYDANVNNASSGTEAALYSIGRALNHAGYDLAQGATGLYGLATDSNLRRQTWNGVRTTVGNAIEHPIDTATGLYSRGVDYYNKTSIGQMGEDALRFGAGGLATAGMAKATGAVGGTALDFLENSQFIMRPVNYSQVNSLSIQTITGQFERITTVTPEMSKAFQGMGYLDPIDNVFKSAPLNKTMAVDHIFPSAEIARLPGFNTLTREQMTNILQDKLDFGNLQPLPKTFNSSKGSSLGWDAYKGQALDTSYMDNLMRTQRDIQSQIREQIRVYQNLNRNGGK